MRTGKCAACPAVSKLIPSCGERSMGVMQNPALVIYTITEKDVSGPFIEKVPEDYREKASLKRLDYTSAQELLAEKFHMSEELLRRLNPDAVFDQAGTQLVVANVQREELPRKISRIEVDASQQRVRAYAKDDSIIAIYPATVGSSERPSPVGEYKVTAVAENPTYHYDPSLNLRGVEVEEKLELPPGPNSPVGTRLDCAIGQGLRHPRHAGARGCEQARVAWLHPADELGRT